MPYKIAGIDVHKRMLAVVVADIAGEGEYKFERHKVGTSPDQLRLLAQWLVEQEAEEVVMESTAQYWKPVWQALERYWKAASQKREGAGPKSGTLHLAQAKSNRGPRGRKNDFADAERLVDYLSDQRFEVNRVAIVGRELEYLEQVLGRLNYGGAALRGAGSGALVGALIGWIFGLFNWIEPLISALVLAGYGLIFGAIVGALFGLLVHALQRGRRDFHSISGLRPKYYDVVAEVDVVDRALRLLAGGNRKE